MMTHCVVKGCQWFKNKPYVKFFNFPTKADEQKSWLSAAKRPSLIPKYKADGLCQFHFDQDDLIIYHNDKKKKPRLKKKDRINPQYFHWNFAYRGPEEKFDDMTDLGNLAYYPQTSYNKSEASLFMKFIAIAIIFSEKIFL